MRPDTPHDGARIGTVALRASASVALVACGTLLLLLQARTLMVILAGILLALALRGASGFMAARTRMPYWAALAALTLTGLAALGAVVFFLGAGMAKQVEALAEQLPAAWHTLLDRIRAQPALAQAVGPMNAEPPRLPIDSGAVFASASGLLELLGGVIVVFFLGLYGAARPEAYSRVALALVPVAHRPRAAAVQAEMARSLTRWLVGRAIAMAVVGVLVTVGLVVMRIPLAVTLGALAGLLAFVEYLGAFASAAPAMLLALSRGPSFVVGVGLLFTVAHVLEGYWLTPLLVRTTVQIPPACTLAAQLVLGATFGVMGLTFATPILIIVTVLVTRYYVRASGGAAT